MLLFCVVCLRRIKLSSQLFEIAFKLRCVLGVCISYSFAQCAFEEYDYLPSCQRLPWRLVFRVVYVSGRRKGSLSGKCIKMGLKSKSPTHPAFLLTSSPVPHLLCRVDIADATPSQWDPAVVMGLPEDIQRELAEHRANRQTKRPAIEFPGVCLFESSVPGLFVVSSAVKPRVLLPLCPCRH